MTWRKHFKPVSTEQGGAGSSSPFTSASSSSKPGPATSNYSSYLPDVYVGSPNRVERYGHYNVMDLDSEVNAGLDILAEFCTQKNKQNGTTFAFSFNRDVSNSEITILSQYLKQWFKLQKFGTRMFQVVRNTFKFGDEVFIRDPETKKLFHVDMANVKRIIVNESEGKIPEQYVFSNINFNFTDLVASSPNQTNNNITGGGSGYLTGGVRGMIGQPNASYQGNRFSIGEDEVAIDAKHVVHVSLSEGLDSNYPFGTSLLETIFKVYKQKELLEDAIIIYRVQRAPERRVFYVDVGNMPSHLAMQFVERVKTEIHQRRIPSRTGGQNHIDSTYNPLCLDLETKIPLLDGRVLPLTEIIDLFDSGEKLWAFSCDPATGKSYPGVIDWAGVTKKDTEVIKLEFDNGNTLVCTPDHKFPVFNQGLVPASKLDATCALFSFDLTAKANEKPTYVRVVKKTAESNRDTGTLTIDINHLHHDYHTFAVDAGVYVKNSINEDFFFPQTCLSLDTNIKMVDGSDKTLQAIIDDYENGMSQWVMGVDSCDGMMEPGEILWAGKTRLDTNTLRVTLENETVIDATPDHIFILSDGSEVLCSELRPGTDLLRAPNPTFGKYGNNVFLRRLLHKMNSMFGNNNTGIKVKTIENNSYNMDTGDITIDTKSNSHWFALSNGNVVHNSEGRGSKVDTLPGGCFAMDTKVTLLDGSEKSIEEISIELENGSELWTNSCDPITGKRAPGLITWAGVTRQSAHVMKITLRNGNEIICTPDHQFPVLGEGFVRAEQLIEVGLLENNSKLFSTKHNFVRSLLNFMVGDINTVDIKSIEYLDEPIEVGTVTIDEDEVNHDYHTFALSAGVFAKNSSLGEISDLKYFTNKLVRGLRVPSSYLPTGDDDGTSSYNDGRVGTAYIQELRFNNYCERLQGLLIGEFDTEFKRYLLERGINIDTNMFELVFEPPQNFASYRQAELDNSRVPTFTTMSAIPFISNRFALKRFLGLSDEEITENEVMWREENADDLRSQSNDNSSELRGAGVSSAGMDADMADLDQELPPGAEDLGMEEDGAENADMEGDGGDAQNNNSNPPPQQ